MTESTAKLIVRTYAPRRRAVLIGVASLVLVAVLYAVFELGRHDAGYRVVDAVRSALSANLRIRALEAENEQQRRQLEAAEVARRVDREGYQQVARSLVDMQSQIARLTQDLNFYRGLVQPDSLVHVKVQQMQIMPASEPGDYHLKFVLMQTGKADKETAGSATLSIEGLQEGKPTVLGLGQLSTAKHASLGYSFKYFQDFDEPLQLPRGFVPTRVDVEIHGGRDLGHAFRQAFVWKAQGMSQETDAGSPGGGAQNVQGETE